jgi:hypothetical protein
MSRARPWLPVLVLGAVAVAFVLVGRPAAALAPVLVAVLLIQASRLGPARLRSAEARVGRGVGAVVGWVLLLPVYVLLFVPAALLSRLLGIDPLRSFGAWRRRGRTTPATRTYADDRSGAPANARWRPAIALVALGAAAAGVLPTVLEDDESEVPARLQGGTRWDATRSAALAGEPWLAQASAEFGEAIVQGSTAAPYVGFAQQDYEGRYVNIEDRRRRSYETTLPGEPLDVWFFGGSTMFGLSAQRDLHTIPSEVVRLAEADGIPVRAHNFGGPGMVNFQETILFSQLVLAGERPDLVVFYDGVNDRSVQLLHAYGGLGRVGEVSDLNAFDVREALAGEMIVNTDPPPPIGDLPEVGPPPPLEDVAQAVVDVYAQGIRLAEDVSRSEFPVLHFWQPDLFVKDELVEGEIELLDALRLDDRRFDGMRRMAEATRARLPEGVVDLADAYDGVDVPVLSDQVHTNELGARLVAEAIYESLGPELARLAPTD